MYVKNFIQGLKNEVINNSAISDKERAEICRYLGRSLCKKPTVEDCKKYLDTTQWPGADDADKLSQWWQTRKQSKNNGHPSQLKGKKNVTIEVTPAELETLNYVRELLSLGVTLKDVTNTLATHRADAEKAAAEKAEKAAAEREAFAKQYAEIFTQYKKLCDAEKTARSYTATAKATNHRRRRESFTPKESVADIRQAALAEFAAEPEHRANSLL